MNVKKRKEIEKTLLEVPTGLLLFHYKDIQQEIVPTLQLEEYGVSKNWVIIMDSRHNSSAALTETETSGPSAQNHYYTRSFGGGKETAWQRRKVMFPGCYEEELHRQRC